MQIRIIIHLLITYKHYEVWGNPLKCLHFYLWQQKWTTRVRNPWQRNYTHSLFLISEQTSLDLIKI